MRFRIFNAKYHAMTCALATTLTRGNYTSYVY